MAGKLHWSSHQHRYKERAVAKCINAQLTDEFGGNHLSVTGDIKVMSHLMIGVLVLADDQWMSLLQ